MIELQYLRSDEAAGISHRTEAMKVAAYAPIGNRVYTGLGDDELYVAVPGPAVRGTLESLGTIVAANTALESFHRQRTASLT